MELLRSTSAPSAHRIASASNQSTATLFFNLQSTFNRKAFHRNLSVFSLPPLAHQLKTSYSIPNLRLRLRRLPPVSAHPTPPPPPPPPPPPLPLRLESNGTNQKLVVVACSAVTVALAIANRVLYKLALVPMKEFPFFLAQLTTFGYVAIYFSTLYTRYKGGKVTDEMLAFPKSPFIIIGFLEALGVVSGMYAGAQLPGPAIPILSQAFLVWQLAFSVLILGRTYAWNKLAGCFLVAAGVLLAVTSGSEHDQMLAGVRIIWPTMMIASTAFQAVASVVKEFVFIDAATRLKGKLLDIFVVNSFGSGFQALFVLLFLPFLSNLKGIPLPELPSYLRSGAACFLNIGATTTGCDGAPLLPLLYIVTNIAFNISALNLLKYSSAVVSSLAIMSSVPISIYILSLPLPYLPEGVTLSPFFVVGSVVLMLGLVLYNFSWPLNQNSNTS